MSDEKQNKNYPFMDKEEKAFFDKYGDEAAKQAELIAEKHGLDTSELKVAYRELMGTFNDKRGEYTVDGALLSCSMCKEREQKIKYKGKDIISKPENVEIRSRIRILEIRTETINGLIPVNIEDCKGGMRDDKSKNEQVNIVGFGNCGQIKDGDELEELAKKAGLSGREEEIVEAINKGMGTCYCFMKLNSEWENLPLAGDYLSGFVMPSAGIEKVFQQAMAGYMNFNGKEGINMLSMLFCKYKDGGIITAQESGQNVIMGFSYDLYDSEQLYKKTADYISKISVLDKSWDSELKNIEEVYERQRKKYEEISKQSGYIPPEVIAAIHYRENKADFMAETFGVYLHNGDSLGTKSGKVPFPAFFGKNDFSDAALNALKGYDGISNYKEIMAKRFDLTPDSKDLTAMTAFTAIYNGWANSGLTSYVYNGTDIFSGGLYTSDHNYDSNAIDQNCGTYLILVTLVKD